MRLCPSSGRGQGRRLSPRPAVARTRCFPGVRAGQTENLYRALDANNGIHFVENRGVHRCCLLSGLQDGPFDGRVWLPVPALSLPAEVPMHEIPLQRVAAIHDLSGFGRASLTVAIPILASMGVQTCPLPTAVLSSQTSGVEGFTFHDLTAEMGPMLDHWQELGLSFDAVYSGFLGNPRQLEIAARCIGHFLKPGGFALVDPVLGDNGTLDPTQTPEMVEAMRQLVGHAHVITPNLTEAAFLLDEPYRPDISPDGLKEQLQRLAAMGPDRVVITSAPAARPGHCAAVAYDRGQHRFWKMEAPYIPAFYPGTGDTFSSVLVGAFLQGDSLPVALERAVRFVTLGIRVTYGYDTRHSDGVLLERTLPALRDRCAIGEYEAF